MRLIAAFGLVLGLLCLTPAGSAKSVENQLRPFTAHYAVYVDGEQRGESVIRLEQLGDGRWRYSVSTEGTSGMARLAGFEADDRSDFLVDAAGQLRLQHLESRSHALFKTREIRADLDWTRRLANWSGDLKADRRAPTRLSDGAVNSSLLNLALALDAADARDGQAFTYQMLDRGSSKQVEYVALPVQSIEVPAGRFKARPLRRDRRDKNRVVSAWYSPQLPPTPVRMLQADNGKPKFEMRLLRID